MPQAGQYVVDGLTSVPQIGQLGIEQLQGPSILQHFPRVSASDVHDIALRKIRFDYLGLRFVSKVSKHDGGRPS